MEEGYKDCPYCAETIRAGAIKCMHCKSFLTGENVDFNHYTEKTQEKSAYRNTAQLRPIENKYNYRKSLWGKSWFWATVLRISHNFGRRMLQPESVKKS